MRFILMLMLLGYALTGLGAQQFQVTTHGIQINQDTSLSLTLSDSYMFNGTHILSRFDQIGYYAVQANGAYRFEAFDTDSIEGNEVKMGDFSAGESVGLYLVDGNRVLDEPMFMQFGDLIGVNVVDWWSGSFDQFWFTAEGGAPGGGTPSGQPLPGVLASFLVGGGLATFVVRRKRGEKMA